MLPFDEEAAPDIHASWTGNLDDGSSLRVGIGLSVLILGKGLGLAWFDGAKEDPLVPPCSAASRRTPLLEMSLVMGDVDVLSVDGIFCEGCRGIGPTGFFCHFATAS